MKKLTYYIMQLTCNMGTFVIMEEPHPHITMATASLSLIDSKNVQKFHKSSKFFRIYFKC